jgi:hypothetical protein
MVKPFLLKQIFIPLTGDKSSCLLCLSHLVLFNVMQSIIILKPPWSGHDTLVEYCCKTSYMKHIVLVTEQCEYTF